jgi:methionyl-tRNA synthetase
LIKKIKYEFVFLRAIAFCEKNFSGKIGSTEKLETQLDQLFVAQITHELNAYLEAMEKTR